MKRVIGLACSLLLVFLAPFITLTGADIISSVTEFTNEPSVFYYFLDSTNVLMKDKNNGFWVSFDEGKQWQQINMPDQGSQIVGHPYSTRRAMILGQSTTHMVTKDKGATFKNSITPAVASRNVLSAVEFGHDNHAYILFHGQDCTSCDTDLYLSKDFGDTWNKIASDVRVCRWGRTPQYDPGVQDTIYCAMDVDGETVFVKSTNFFLTKTVLISKKTYGFSLSGAFLLVATESVDGNCESCGSLHVSAGKDDFSLAEFPPNIANSQYTYNIIKSQLKRVLVGVSTTNSVGKWATLLESDSTGSQFVTSIEHVDVNGVQLDIKRIDSVLGTMLVNLIANPNEVESGEEKTIVSKISYDDGSIWSLIDAPSTDDCPRQQECSLHFHRRTERHPEGLVTSSSSAPGMAMGVGSIGESLKPYDDCKTYLTRDGGRTWKMVLNGPYLYQFADQGALLVVANDKDPRKYLRYSIDNGNTWTRYDFHTTDIIVKGILTEPKSTSRRVLIYGTSSTGGTKKYIISHVDFTGLLTRQCAESDMEQFRPGDCILGQGLIYTRKKEEAQCYIGKEFEEPEVETVSCDCTQADFECDYGFQRTDDGICERVGKEPLEPVDCIPGAKYNVSSGYRLIPGNKCTKGNNGVWYEPIEKTCEGTTQPSPTPTGTEQQLIQKYLTTFVDSISTYKYLGTTGVILLLDSQNKIFKSSNEGRTWSEMSFSEKIKSIEVSPYDSNVVVFLSTGTSHWISFDATNTVKKLQLSNVPISGSGSLSFHPTLNQYIIFVAFVVNGQNRYREALLTKNGGDTWFSLNTYIDKCYFPKQPLPGSTVNDIYCSEYPEKSGIQFSQARILKLTRSSNFFATRQTVLESVVDFAVYSKYIVAVVNDENIHLYTSTDGTFFSSARFPQDLEIEENGYFLHKSAKEAIYVDVFSHDTSAGNMGTLLISNSLGTEFSLSLLYTNRNEKGKVDFERMEGLRGILLANRIINPEQVIDGEEKIIESVISFNDGGSWFLINAPDKTINGINYSCRGLSKCTLHLHSVTELTQPGMIYSASSAIGLMMGVGNVGAYLLPYASGNTYLTRDAGVTWKEVKSGPHHFEFSDRGAIIIAVPDGIDTDTLSYSWNEGDTWKNYVFSNRKVKVLWITTEPGSASQKILLMAQYKDINDVNVYEMIQVDFSGLHVRKCGDEDFEEWTPTGPNNICLFGKKVTYTRRKPTSECYIGEDDLEVVEDEQICECTQDDYECSYTHVKEGNACVLASWANDQPDYCVGSYSAPSGYVKVPGDACFGGLKLDQPVTKQCQEVSKVKKTEKIFSGYVDYHYFEQSNTVLLLDQDRNLWRSFDEGTNWSQVTSVSDIVAIIRHPTKTSTVFLLTESKTHYYTTDGGNNFISFQSPIKRSYYVSVDKILSLHPDEPSWILFTGDNCPENSQTCQHDDTFFSADTGKTWKLLESYVEKCVWGKTPSFNAPKSTVFCMSHTIKTGLQDVLYRNPNDVIHMLKYDSPNSVAKTVLTDVVGFEIFDNFLAIGTEVVNSNGLDLYIATDVDKITKATFPQSVQGVHYGYSFLESSTGTIFMDIFTSNSQVGTLLTSDSTGYKFSLALRNINQLGLGGITDFEKFQGIKGIILANVVTNVDSLSSSVPKSLSTVISYDNGGRWKRITAPTVDANGKDIACGSKCYLHLVGPTGLPFSPEGYYFTSSSSIGLAMAVGNVGEKLSSYVEGNTYLTNDAGLTWKEVRKGPHLFAFGDRGALIVIVNDKDATNHVRYSWNEGKTWNNFDFSPEKYRAKDLITHRDTTSQKFILLATKTGDSSVYTFTIDFTDLHERKCTQDDFENWVPSDHVGGSCILGEKITYQRRKADSECSIDNKLMDPEVSTQKCACEEIDYECDIDYFLAEDGSCQPLYEVSQPNPCPVGSSYKTASGFRKVPANKCQGGIDLTLPITKYCKDSSTSAPTNSPSSGPTTPTTPTTSPTAAPSDSPHSSKGLGIGAWAAIIIIPVVVLVLMVAGLIYHRKYHAGEIRFPRFFRNIRYSRISANDNIENLVDDYEL